MSQNLINAIDLPSGSLPTTPVVIKDNDLAGMFNTSDYKYYPYGIPELSYIKFNGNNTVVKSTDIIQAVENGYYPIIVVSSGQVEQTRLSNSEYPSSQLDPGIWGFSYYFYKNSIPYAMFTCLQSFETSSDSDIIVAKVNDNMQLKADYDPTITLPNITDYLGRFDVPVVDTRGNWTSTANLFRESNGGGVSYR